ncbi:MAG: hypothetical protein ACRD1C_05035 [Terriglobales bacterium]
MRCRALSLALTLALGLTLAPLCPSQAPQDQQVSSLKGLTLAQFGDIVVTTPTQEPGHRFESRARAR